MTTSQILNWKLIQNWLGLLQKCAYETMDSKMGGNNGSVNAEKLIPAIVQSYLEGQTVDELLSSLPSVYEFGTYTYNNGCRKPTVVSSEVANFVKFVFVTLSGIRKNHEDLISLLRLRYRLFFEVALPLENKSIAVESLVEDVIQYVTGGSTSSIAVDFLNATKKSYLVEEIKEIRSALS